MSLVNKICGSFIYMFSKYRKMWIAVQQSLKEHPSPSRKEYTYTDFFKHNVGIGVFFSNHHYPRGLSEKLFYYIGCKTGWLKRYKIECDISMENTRNSLEEAFTPQLKKMLKDKLKDAG